MKFSLFLHIESVGRNDDYAALYGEFIDLCKMADDGGFDAVWVGEHHGMGFTVSPNPFLILADLAKQTKNVRLGTGAIVAPFWHPIKLAGEAAMCDLITKGRLDIGIARGAYRFEYERLAGDMDGWKAGQCLREIIPAIKICGAVITPTTANTGVSQNQRRAPNISKTAPAHLGGRARPEFA